MRCFISRAMVCGSRQGRQSEDTIHERFRLPWERNFSATVSGLHKLTHTAWLTFKTFFMSWCLSQCKPEIEPGRDPRSYAGKLCLKLYFDTHMSFSRVDYTVAHKIIIFLCVKLTIERGAWSEFSWQKISKTLMNLESASKACKVATARIFLFMS